MKYFSSVISFLQRQHPIVPFVWAAALIFALINVGAQSRARAVSGQDKAGDKAGAQLQAAASANSEAELQRVESSFPGTEEAALAHFLRGYLRFQAKDFSTAATLLADQNIARLTAIGDYALYYRGQALQEAARAEEAEREFRRLAEFYPSSLLARTATLQSAGSAMLRGDYQTATGDLTPLVEKNDGAALKLRADALEKAGRVNEAILTLRKLYYDAPQSAEADKVGARLTALGATTAPADAAQQIRRADRLYEAKLYALAAQAYGQIPNLFPNAATGDVGLRAGVSYYKSNSFKQAVDALSQVRSRSPKVTCEALYYKSLAQLSLDSEAAGLETLAELRRVAPSSERIGDLLYAAGRHYAKSGRDGQASAYYTQLVRQFPQAEGADDAHFWLAWRAHLAKDYRTSSRLLTEHVANYSDVTDNRGRAGFWAAYDAERSGDKETAMTLYRAMLLRYGAGWFGVNAERRIAKLASEGVRGKPFESDLLLRRAVAGLQTVKLPQETVNDADAEHVTKAEQLTRVTFYQSAMNELDAAREKYPNSPSVNLRIAQIFRIQGEPVAALNALKRAYPDYGQMLPEEATREVWEVFYPLKWWSNIKEESKRHNLDPYMIAGLIRQESVFIPNAHSYANAYGLMQLLPYVGRDVARKTGAGAITTNDLFNPVLNIQLGTAFVKELMDKFNRFEYAAAAYNGGPTRVSKWLKELPTAEIEEWVESIPIEQTRLYVQSVYRNARQYQRLYDEQGNFRISIPK
ncbi:MAG TPA: transglycosylase SLT domain-containing protein [Blastocatellia bacterium]|nr:transglycosylase SLT domain-containing protein [Blastocatellia bacterium]